ncbi:MAG: helix-turn-helix domain-containing protein [Ruminococcus sp.]|nr:helix-turn-helix domain-containing protein [Ruminococcus sp.]
MFYDNLKTICEKQNLKITTIVIECGGAPGSINGWKKGSMPNSNIVIALAMRLNVSTDYLLLGKEHQSNANNSFNNNNIAYGDNSKVQISSNSDDTEDEICRELSKVIKSLPLKERSKLITMIYDFEEQYRESNT